VVTDLLDVFFKSETKKPRIAARLFINGGTFKIHVTIYFPQLQIIDKITQESKKDPIDEFFLKQKYLEEGLSSSEIAKITFSSRPTITKRLKQYGIPLKKITRRDDGSHVFGYRKFGGKAIELKKEQEVIELIKSHRASGYSYQKIADIMNTNGIETKMRRGFWYSKVIRQIYLRAQ
jgi:DNA-binding CsgD family transcriptional regulator